MTQCLEELGTRAEVRLLQPARTNRNQLVGKPLLGSFQTRGKEGSAFMEGWGMQQMVSPHHLFHLQVITFHLLVPAVWPSKPSAASSELLLPVAQVGRDKDSKKALRCRIPVPAGHLILQVLHKGGWVRWASALTSRFILVLQ